MTVSSAIRKAGPYAGNSSATVFTFAFKVFDKTDVTVIRANGLGAGTVLALDVDFSVSLNSDQNNEPGGAITYPLTGSPLPAGYTLTLLGALPYEQPTDITNMGGFYPDVIEDALDRQEIQIQQIAEIAGRAVQVPPGDGSSLVLPSSGARSRSIIGFDDNGNITLLPIPSSVGAGDMLDEIGSDGSPGLLVGVDIAVGATQILLSRAPGSKANVLLQFDGVWQGGDQIASVIGNVLTLVPPGVPIGTQRVYVRTGTTLSISRPAQQSVGDDSIAPGTKLSNRISTINVKDFGAVGDGVADDSDAVQNAINAAAPFLWEGSTRATELAACGGAVYFPRGIYRVTRKIRLAPHLRLVGDGPTDDFAARNGSAGVGTGGKYGLGSAIFADFTGFGTYAFDTSPYNAAGVRTDDRLQSGGDSFNAAYTQVAALSIENMTLYGRWTCKGLNLAGAELVRLSNVYIKGFTVGVRGSAIWYGSYENVRIVSNYRGILNWGSVTDLTMTNVNVVASVDGITYNPAVSGRDSGDPLPAGDLTQSMIDLNTGIVNYYGNIEGLNVTVENFPQCFLSMNAVDSYRGIYVEGCSGVILRVQGSDQQNAYFEFDTITSNSGDVLWASQARITIEARNHNYTQSGFNKLVNFLNTAGVRAYVPVFRGVYLNPNDFIPATSFRTLADEYSEGGWYPILGFGGTAAGTQSVTTGKWIRNGRLVTAKFSIRIPTLSGATGNAAISGIPFMPENVDGTDFMGGVVAFSFNAPAGMLAQVQPGVQGIYLTNNAGSIQTQAGFSNGCDIRGYVTYMVQAGA